MYLLDFENVLISSTTIIRKRIRLQPSVTDVTQHSYNGRRAEYVRVAAQPELVPHLL